MGNTKHLVGLTRPTYTIDEETRENLIKLSERFGESRSAIVRKAVAKLRKDSLTEKGRFITKIDSL